MKKLLSLVALSLLLGVAVSAQLPQPLVQSFTENIIGAPAAVVTGQNFSNTTSTGASTSSTGGTVAAGTYRICVTFFSSANTETPCSTDTASTATIVTTGSTSTVTVYPPVVYFTGGGNVVGYRVYVGANGGAAAAETLQTLNSTVCTLSSSATASCALTSPAIFTASTNFSAGSGGPASPGTLLYPPTGNQANTALFENSQYFSHIIQWAVSGTAPSACTFNLQTGSTVAGLANVGQTITCTSSGSYSVPYSTTNAYSSINLATYTAGGTNTVTTFTEYVLPYIFPFYWVNATPTGNCPNGVSAINTAAASTSTVLYVCQPANTWAAITQP